MEDFLKFLLIAGVLLVGIFKEVNKNKSKTAKNKRPVSPKPSPVEIAPDATPLPEAWNRGGTMDELLRPIPIEPPTPKPASKPFPKPVAKQKRKKEEISVAASIANSSAQDERNAKQGSHYSPQRDSSGDEQDFAIHSAEEARRAIIWGEILQRKY